MVKVILSGCNGKMGQVVTAMCQANPDMEIVAGVDICTVQQSDYPVYASPAAFDGAADCIIDFSNPAALTSLLDYCRQTGCAVVLATTGYSDAQLQEIADAAKEIRIFRSANMSLGINVLVSLVRQAAKILGSSWDIDIVEKHHNRKLDAPSGTAVMIADAAAAAREEDMDYVYSRHDVRQKRGQNEIGISSVRGGTIVGEHEVLFAGTDEVLEIRHSAYSREIFANGAVRAAAYVASRTDPGIYDMENLVAEVTDNA